MKEIKDKAANVLTDTGSKFYVNEHEFIIRPLKLGTLVQISQQVNILTPATKNNATREEQIKLMANDAPIKARIIALAVINSKPRKKKIFDFKSSHENFNADQLTEFFLNELDSSDTNRISNLIISMMGINDFFQATVSLKGIDLLTEESKTVTDQPIQFGGE